ncbi:PepSY domain-containing protein [Streptomyces sp. NPDC100445]|uniref:PepSY domain-containing protein n=1 Tax=Streptomyces sp. NPDC100445 TaxID=3366102 RepID=UPI003815FD0F
MRTRGSAATGTASALAGFLATGALLVTGTACQSQPPEHRPEALPQVEARYDRAVLTALSEVPGTKVFSVRVADLSSQKPVWLTRVAEPNGTVHTVRVDAIHGRFVDTSVPADQSSARKSRIAALIASAKVLPHDAVDKVKEPDFGKVTDVSLEKGYQGRTVWSVTIDTVQGGQTHVYQIDAVTSKVIHSSTIPGDSAIPSEPASPPASSSGSPR